MSASDSIDGFEIGSRVSDSESFRGTIRYIGPVAAAKDPNERYILMCILYVSF